MVFHIAVFTPAGATAFTRIGSLRVRHSFAAARVNIPTAALLAEYALAPADGRMPDADDTLTMLPPRDVIARIACLVPRKRPSRLTAKTRRQSASAISATGAPKEIPAEFTRTSNCPEASTTR